MNIPDSRPRLAARLGLALVLMLLAAAAIGQGSSEGSAAPRLGVVVAARVRQGDPLLAWTVFVPTAAYPAAGAASPEARLLDSGGRAVARSPCFDASSLLAGDSALPPGAVLYGALFAIPPALAAGEYSVAVAWRAGGPRSASAPLAVEARAFAVETIHLDQANARLQSEPTPRKTDEALRLQDLVAAIHPGAVYADASPFLFPTEGGFKSAGFGDGRRYAYPNGGSETSVHAGLDWGVVVGTPVRACARGRVALVADREVTGTTVVLEHLPGLYSLYFHLSKAEVADGEIVERGKVIALSGASGLATGPHLHWELRCRGAAVEPEAWLQPPLLDKDAIKDKIVALIEGR